MSTSREIRFTLPIKYAEVFDRACAEHSLNQRDMLIWLLSPLEKRQTFLDNVAPTQTARAAIQIPTANTNATSSEELKDKVANWKRDAPLTADEMVRFKALNKGSIANQSMTPVERTELYAYTERYQNYHR